MTGVVARRAGWIRLAVITLLLVLGVLGIAGAANAATPGVTLQAVVNGRPAATSSDARPAQLYPTAGARFRIKVVNHSSQTVRVSTVRFQGSVLDLPLFSYDTAVDLAVPPGGVRSLQFPVVLNGIGSQATGLVAASITLLSSTGTEVASQTVVTNIHGKLTSIYGLFGLVVLILTISSLGFALLAMARHSLSPNRWARGIRFAIPGFGVGLVLTFTLSVFRVFVPSAGHWLPLLIVPTVAGLALGFLTPAPNEEEFDDYDDDVLVAQIVVVDDDPLEDGHAALPSEALVTAGSAARSGNATVAPSPTTRPSGHPSAPDSRSTVAPSAPDSRSTVAPSSPDSRSTVAPSSPSSPDNRATVAPLAPDSRSTVAPNAPDSRPTAPPSRPDSRPTAEPLTRPTAPPDSRPTAPPEDSD